jgi:hypothetical protein
MTDATPDPPFAMADVIQLPVDFETIAEIWELVTVANEFTGDPTDVQLLKKAAANVVTRLRDIDLIDLKRSQNAEQHAKDKLELRRQEARLSTELEMVRPDYWGLDRYWGTTPEQE